jgi:hypothetical protein
MVEVVTLKQVYPTFWTAMTTSPGCGWYELNTEIDE